MNSQTFLSQVRDHSLLDEEQLAEVSRCFDAAAPLHEVTETLVDKGWMTAYQVERIWAGQTKGLLLGQYRILEELGRGGFGCVFKAKHIIMNRMVALKVIAPERVDDSRARAWFRREVLASTQFQHPNIVMAFDANEVDDTLFLVMEYVDGPNLADHVKKQGPLPIGLACALMLQAARGLQYADEKGMVHRDIKPANLLLPNVPSSGAGARRDKMQPAADIAAANQVLVKIVDFGLARLHGQGSSNTLMGVKDKGFMGTPDYIAPEQARDIHDADIRADLYSLGCTFFFALTGRPPFRGQTPLEIVLQHLEQEPPTIDALRPEVPPALVSIVRRLMAKKPEQRFQSPGELVAELNFFFGSAGAQTAPPMAPFVQPSLKSPAASFRPEVPPLRAWDAFEAAADVNAAKEMPCTLVVSSESLGAPLPSAHAEPAVTATAQRQSDAAAAAGPAQASSVTFGGDTANTFAGLPVLKPASLQESVARGELEARFREQWRHWVAVVDDLTAGRKLSVKETVYGVLHADLIHIVQIMSKATGASSDYGLLEAAILPWVTLRSLEQTDRQTLGSLRQRCRQLEQKLNLVRPPSRRGAWALGAAVLFLVSLAAYWFTSGIAVAPRGVALSTLKDYATAHPFLTLALSVPPIVFGSLYLLSRSDGNRKV